MGELKTFIPFDVYFSYFARLSRQPCKTFVKVINLRRDNHLLSTLTCILQNAVVIPEGSGRPTWQQLLRRVVNRGGMFPDEWPGEHVRGRQQV